MSRFGHHRSFAWLMKPRSLELGLGWNQRFALDINGFFIGHSFFSVSFAYQACREPFNLDYSSPQHIKDSLISPTKQFKQFPEPFNYIICLQHGTSIAAFCSIPGTSPY